MIRIEKNEVLFCCEVGDFAEHWEVIEYAEHRFAEHWDSN